MGEYILYHAKIWTAEKEAEWADAMWVSGDKILGGCCLGTCQEN